MRYFFIYYTANGQNNTGNGCLWIKTENFPNNIMLKKHISKKYNYDVGIIIITNLFEFNNEKDYLDFTSEEVEK